MSLQAKILFIVLVVVSLYAVSDYASQWLLVLPSFVSLERDTAQKSMERCAEALNREIYLLDTLTKDWAARNDTYQFVEDRNDNYISTNLLIKSFTDNNLNLIYICNEIGEVIWGEIRDLETEQIMQVNEFPMGSLPGTHPLLGHKTAESSTAGVFITERGPMLVASRPIITSENKGPIRGTLIMGRFLNDNVIEALAEQTPVDLKIWTIANDSIPAEDRDVLDHVKTEAQFHIRELSNSLLRAYKLFSDVQGTPALLMWADIPRNIRTNGVVLIRSSLFSILAAGLLVSLVLLVLLRRAVVGPIKELTNHAIAISRSNNVSARLSMQRSDEIGILAREFDHMVEQLAEARKKLCEQSYYAGRAEMASGILHNVRNMLTPIVSRIDYLRQRFREAPLRQIEIAQAELAEGKPSDQRREDLTRFTNIANKSLATMVRETKDKWDDIVEQVMQIEKMLIENSKFGRTEPSIEEEVQLDNLMRDSIALLPDDLREGISIEMDPCVEVIEPLMAHRVGLLLVFGNILINAAESICRAGSIHGQICIRAQTNQVDGVDMIHVQISDNGESIEPCNLNRIFERGFSSKQNGSSGLGLHWCANTIATMNGRIYAESEGRGHGACFHILLPASQKTVSVLD